MSVNTIFPSPAKGFLVGKGAGLTFSVNPSQIQRQAAATYASSLAPGSPGAYVQYTGGGECNVTFELVLESIGGGSVTSQMEALEAFTQSSGQFVPPPEAVLGIGSRTWDGYVSQVQFTEEMFNASFEPVYAKAQVNFVINNYK